MKKLAVSIAVVLSVVGCGPAEDGADGFANNFDSVQAGHAGSAGHGASGKGTGGQGAAGTLHAGGGAAGSADKCGDGLDNNGNGHVDEGCACEVGKSQKCFLGDGSHAGKGACSWGTQVCKKGTGTQEFNGNYWGDCVGYGKPAPETCDGKDNDCNGTVDDGCDCQNGAEQACSSSCGDGTQTCKAGKWGACDAPQVDSKGQCPCNAGALQACSTNCGAGTQTCAAGIFGSCNAPMPDAQGHCPCPNGQIRGTDGNCFTPSACQTETDDGQLSVDAGDKGSKTMSCPPGLYATHGHYSGTKMPCDWSSTDTSVTLHCDNSDSGSHRDANHVTITCSCIKPSSVELDCSNCD